jgi:hypothetical protein
MAARVRWRGTVPGQLSFDDMLDWPADYSDKPPPGRGHYVYRFWTADDICLYVGVTGIWRPLLISQRLRSHKTKQQPWVRKSARADFASFASAADAMAEEDRQIAALQPRYNKVGRPNARRKNLALQYG